VEEKVREGEGGRGGGGGGGRRGEKERGSEREEENGRTHTFIEGKTKRTGTIGGSVWKGHWNPFGSCLRRSMQHLGRLF